MTRSDDSAVPNYSQKLRLDGRGFLVVGAGQGIGRQTSHALANCGAKVVCWDVDPDLAHDIAKQVDGIPVSGDVRERQDVHRVVGEAHNALGRLQGVIDIVGMSRYTALLDADDEDWAWHHDLVLKQAWMVMQECGLVMKDSGGGVMVFVASVSGTVAAPKHAAYGAAKAGLISLVQSGAVELGPYGIRINAVAPGVVWTPRVSAYLGDAGRKRNSDNAPLGRVALPEDIAACLLFLASDLSAYVDGQTLTVDGGVSAKFPYPLPDGV
jgi:NAD(P)-dependent dehydrogenase (short-subunit alcohol dehydrogenase family)